jgi:hypothetical protein
MQQREQNKRCVPCLGQRLKKKKEISGQETETETWSHPWHNDQTRRRREEEIALVDPRDLGDSDDAC